jgi:hypothetical protein
MADLFDRVSCIPPAFQGFKQHPVGARAKAVGVRENKGCGLGVRHVDELSYVSYLGSDHRR